MHTLVPSCEQIMPGNATADESDGKIGSGGPAPGPLQGGADSRDTQLENETGAEGDGS